MKIIFSGTPDFAASHLRALIDSEHEICAVYTQPDRPKGRGRKLVASSVKELALENNIPVYQPRTLKNKEAQQELDALGADLMVVVAYGLILPKVVLESPRLGCINVHGSLLPKWRGAAPIQQAVLAGDSVTGVTVMQMDEGLDTGDMLYKAEVEIFENETSASLYDKLALIGPDALLEALSLLEANKLNPEKQNDAQATYAHKLKKSQSEIDWQKSARQIDCQIRGLNPWPVATIHYKESVLRVWQASIVSHDSKRLPGEVVAINKKTIEVATGDGVLALEVLQLPGGRAMAVADILNGKKLDWQIGDCLTDDN